MLFLFSSADLSIPRTTTDPSMVRLPLAQNPMEPVNFAQAKPSYVQGGHDPSVLGLIPVGSKQTSVIVSNQSLMSDPTAQATTSMAETLAEQTIMAGGNRFVLHMGVRTAVLC